MVLVPRDAVRVEHHGVLDGHAELAARSEQHVLTRACVAVPYPLPGHPPGVHVVVDHVDRVCVLGGLPEYLL